jgi:tRNA-specific 2-thiouridylase
VIDTRDHFRRSVIDDFLQGYLSGTTPNPCVRCNERVKLRHLLELADERGIEFVATGHYARVLQRGHEWQLHRAVDPRKDQSYFLYRLRLSWLPRLLFPVGAMHKSDVWKEAESLGLPAEELKESQEICFVSQGDYRTFIERERPDAKKAGAFIDLHGRELGRHEGIAFYTPGQRRGLGVAAGRRLYVQKVVPESGQVVLCSEEDLSQTECEVSDLNFLGEAGPPRHVSVKVRYATPADGAELLPSTEGRMRVRFHEPQRALSPGQSAVFYEGERVLGGGIIHRM